MEMYLNTNFSNIENDELDSINGGVASIVVVALLGCLGTGFTAGVAVGLNKKNRNTTW